MESLAVKEVDFNGNSLLAAQDNTSKKVYVAVRWVSEGIGLTIDQAKRQMKNIKQDLVISQGVSDLTLLTKGGEQRVLCIELDYLPLWLAKISITPKMKENSPDTVDNLIKYQLKAKDVLANAFINNVTQIVPKSYKEALVALVESIEEKEQLEQQLELQKPKVTYYDKILKSKGSLNITQIAKDYSMTAQELNKLLNKEKIQYKQGGQWLLYKKYQDRGYTETDTYLYIDSDIEEKKSRVRTKWTQKGRLFIHDLLVNKGVVAKMDKNHMTIG